MRPQCLLVTMVICACTAETVDTDEGVAALEQALRADDVPLASQDRTPFEKNPTLFAAQPEPVHLVNEVNAPDSGLSFSTSSTAAFIGDSREPCRTCLTAIVTGSGALLLITGDPSKGGYTSVGNPALLAAEEVLWENAQKLRPSTVYWSSVGNPPAGDVLKLHYQTTDRAGEVKNLQVDVLRY